MIYAFQCWVRRHIFRRQFHRLGRHSLECGYDLALRRIADLEARCSIQLKALDIAARNGNWRWSNPLAAHFMLNPELRRIMQNRFKQQQEGTITTKSLAEHQKKVLDLYPTTLQLHQS